MIFNTRIIIISNFAHRSYCKISQELKTNYIITKNPRKFYIINLVNVMIGEEKLH